MIKKITILKIEEVRSCMKIKKTGTESNQIGNQKCCKIISKLKLS